jgi:hypothetical protein
MYVCVPRENFQNLFNPGVHPICMLLDYRTVDTSSSLGLNGCTG